MTSSVRHTPLRVEWRVVDYAHSKAILLSAPRSSLLVLDRMNEYAHSGLICLNCDPELFNTSMSALMFVRELFYSTVFEFACPTCKSDLFKPDLVPASFSVSSSPESRASKNKEDEGIVTTYVSYVEILEEPHGQEDR